MGVTVQLMVDALVSGVMFTCNPVSGDPSTVAVNASWGLGSAVVAGEVTPDEYRVNKVTRRGDRAHDRPEGGRGRAAPGRAPAPRAWTCPPSGARPPASTTRRWPRCVEVAGRIERHFGSHQDIEWALSRDDGELLVLQSRPVTVRPAATPWRRSRRCRS